MKARLAWYLILKIWEDFEKKSKSVNSCTSCTNFCPLFCASNSRTLVRQAHSIGWRLKCGPAPHMMRRYLKRHFVTGALTLGVTSINKKSKQSLHFTLHIYIQILSSVLSRIYILNCIDGLNINSFDVRWTSSPLPWSSTRSSAGKFLLKRRRRWRSWFPCLLSDEWLGSLPCNSMLHEYFCHRMLFSKTTTNRFTYQTSKHW